MHCVYLALWTRKVLCGRFLCAIYKFSFIHSFSNNNRERGEREREGEREEREREHLLSKARLSTMERGHYMVTVTCLQSMGQVSKPSPSPSPPVPPFPLPPPPPPPPPPPEIFGDNDFWIAQYVSFQYLLVCKMNYSAVRDYLRWYIAALWHVLKWACPLQIPNNRQLYHSLDTQKYCTCWYQWVALLLRLLLSYPDVVAWITRVGLMKIEKKKIHVA